MSTYLTNAAINPQLEQELEGQCIFCLQFLRTRNEVWKLPCAHRSCSGCLKEMIARRRDVKCPTCRLVHEGVQLENCPIIYARQIFLCSGSSCKGEAKNYCKKCMKCHCEPHQQYHDEFHLDHQDSVIPIEQYRIEVDRYTDRMCTEHNMSEEIKTACSKCHKPLCLSCLGADRCEDETGHEVVALKKVADSMKDVLQTDVKKIIEFDEKLEGSFKEINNQTETLAQRQTDMKKKLNEAVERVIDEVRLFAQELAVKIDDRIANELVKLREYEKDLNPVHGETKQLITKTSQLSSSNDLDIIRHQSKLSPEIEDFCPEQPAVPTVPIFSLSNLREKISFPWEMIVTEPFYKSLTHNENIPTESLCFTVCHLPDGKLIHGGRYGLMGLNEKPDLEGQVNCINIDQGSGDLLILCYSASKNKRFVYKIDPHTSQSELLFSYPRNDPITLQHLTANSRYIITTDLPTSLKVFDKVAKELLYDIKLAEIKRPMGVEFLDDRSVIVSDAVEGKVFRVLVAENSQILWTLGGLEWPSGVHIDHEKKNILVISGMGRQLYVISFTGELLATITVPDGNKRMHDISVYGSELAVARRDHGVQKFTLERVL